MLLIQPHQASDATLLAGLDHILRPLDVDALHQGDVQAVLTSWGSGGTVEHHIHPLGMQIQQGRG
jgi:hypothetical protein